MTDKEQIIIDGVDVSGCILRMRKEPNCTVCRGYSSTVFGFDCSDFKNCEFKQLARKTQENEELENKLKTAEEWRIKAEGLNEKLDLKNTRYHKALEEIEKVAIKTNRDLCNNCGWVNTISCIPSEYICGDVKQILDIINKVKGEE